MSDPEDTIFSKAYSKGRARGYLEALRDILKKEERVLLLIDDANREEPFQVQTFVVESKHIRTLINSMVRDKDKDM